MFDRKQYLEKTSERTRIAAIRATQRQFDKIKAYNEKQENGLFIHSSQHIKRNIHVPQQKNKQIENSEPVLEEVVSVDKEPEPVLEEVVSVDKEPEPVLEEVVSVDKEPESVLKEVVSVDKEPEPDSKQIIIEQSQSQSQSQLYTTIQTTIHTVTQTTTTTTNIPYEPQVLLLQQQIKQLEQQLEQQISSISFPKKMRMIHTNILTPK